jgi:hypothetical protein
MTLAKTQVQITLWACERVPKDVSSTRQIGALLEGVPQSTGRGGAIPSAGLGDGQWKGGFRQAERSLASRPRRTVPSSPATTARSRTHHNSHVRGRCPLARPYALDVVAGSSRACRVVRNNSIRSRLGRLLLQTLMEFLVSGLSGRLPLSLTIRAAGGSHSLCRLPRRLSKSLHLRIPKPQNSH